jgi:hypothetical protein
LASLGRRHRFGIKKAAVCHRELRFDHLPDQLVFIVQEPHHFERGWGDLNPRRSCRGTQWVLENSKPPTLASITALSNRAATGLFHGIAIAILRGLKRPIEIQTHV